MKAMDALNILSDLMASQRGLVTTAQAEAAGVDRHALSRLERNGHIERVMSGVYRSCAAPSFREERVYVAWLALDRAVPAWERARDESDVVASHGTAAWLMGLGELNPEPITFTSVERRQSARPGLRLVKASLVRGEIVQVSGIPTTSPERTVLDLLRDGEDESLVSNALRDFLRDNPDSVVSNVREKVDEVATRCGHPAGYPLFEALLREAQL